jgi:hypothetical protein
MGAALLLVRHLIWCAYQIRYFAGARADPLGTSRDLMRSAGAAKGRATKTHGRTAIAGFARHWRGTGKRPTGPDPAPKPAGGCRYASARRHTGTGAASTVADKPMCRCAGGWRAISLPCALELGAIIAPVPNRDQSYRRSRSAGANCRRRGSSSPSAIRDRDRA